MKIITLTLNPAFDIHCECEEFRAFSENLADITSKDAGGKGVNISRALIKNGIENTAYIVLGNENSDEFLGKLEDEGIKFKEFLVSGRIRENITLHSSKTPETRISFSGFSADDSVIDRINEKLKKEDLSQMILTFTGRIPDGISKGYVKSFLVGLKEKGVKIIVDSKSFDKYDIVEIKPWLIKPNEEEVGLYSDILVKDIESAKVAAVGLNKKGIENVIVSLGERGAVFAGYDGVFEIVPPKIKIKSTIGAGDSMISGFVFGIKKGMAIQETLKFAAAFGSAACLREGTNPPEWEEILKISEKVEVRKYML